MGLSKGGPRHPEPPTTNCIDVDESNERKKEKGASCKLLGGWIIIENNQPTYKMPFLGAPRAFYYFPCPSLPKTHLPILISLFLIVRSPGWGSEPGPWGDRQFSSHIQLVYGKKSVKWAFPVYTTAVVHLFPSRFSQLKFTLLLFYSNLQSTISYP